jgi:hypothetical protein
MRLPALHPWGWQRPRTDQLRDPPRRFPAAPRLAKGIGGRARRHRSVDCCSCAMVALSAQARFRAARNAAGRSSHHMAARQPCLDSPGCHGSHVAHGPHPDRWSRRSRKPVPLRSGGWAINRDRLHRDRLHRQGPRRACGRRSHTCSKSQIRPQAEGPTGECVGKVRTLRGQAARTCEIARLRAGVQQATPAGTGVADKPARIRQIERRVLPGNSNDLTGSPMTRPPGSHEET